MIKQEGREIIIPSSEYTIESFRSSGPGGQNVNKVATAKRLRFNIGLSQTLTEEQKNKIREVLAYRITKNDEILIKSEKTRSAEQNEKDAIEKFQQLINKALKPEKERIPTKPTKGSQEKRIQKKKERGEIKKLRQKRFDIE
ncbi:MAG: alternative ribosome rescue aminoacyl-tRNA hydrolase ArfB [Patescibacteria group bacterium]